MGVTFGDNQFVVVGGKGVILTGSSGINWTSRFSSINVDLLDAAYGNGVYVVVGNSGKILTSTDFVTWDSRSSGVRGNLSGVVYGNLRFVAVGAGEIIYSMCDQPATASVLNYKLQNTNHKQNTNYNTRNYNNIKIDPTGQYAQGSRPPFQLHTPNGNETIYAGEKFLITWESDREIEKVKLEYSPDNGTTYLPIAVDVANIGHYEWVVPHHISSHCLVRVSEVKERKMPPHGLVYEMDFRVNGVDISGSGKSFFIFLGDAVDESIKNNLPGVSFSHEANGKVYIHLDDTGKEIGRFTGFNDRWHNIRIFMDNVYDRISVILDGVLMFENIPRAEMAYFSPAISFSVGLGHAAEVDVDDVIVRAWYAQEDKNQWFTLFSEDFEQLNGKNGMGSSGWRTKSKQTLESDQIESGLKNLSIKPAEDKQVTVVKTFNIPLDFPFDVSDNTFEIRYNDDMFSDTAAYDQIDGFPGHGGSGASTNNFYSSSSTILSNSTPGRSRTSELINTYYIYTFDGKLLAEYDHNGSCVRDYIYAGNRLIAEYKPQTNEYFYYITDQINSTRIITNDSGNVVFSEAAGPYGDVQKTWTNTYDPKLKFSGKEREGYSDLDYFGARYYDHKSYRFNSVDPVITRDKALSDPQLWNLYVYCRNNPITFLDPDGRELRTTQIKTMQEIAGPAASSIKIAAGKLDVSGLSQSAMSNNEGATLLYELATSNYVYTYSEGPTGGVSNLDNKPDWRFPNGKSSKFLPPPGVDCAVGIDPSIKYVDAATGTLNVSNAAIAFHELAEAYGKVDLGKPYVQKGGGAGAHEYARQREKTLNNQRPGFTQYPAGETLKKK